MRVFYVTDRWDSAAFENFKTLKLCFLNRTNSYKPFYFKSNV